MALLPSRANCRVLFRQQFTKFVAVGIVNSVFGYGCYAVLIYSGLHYTFALLFATILGVLFNFKSISVLVFGSNNNRLIFRFVGCYAVVYLGNVSGIKVLSYMGFEPYIAGAILIVPAAILSFILNKRFVFNNV
jgi:putative flippase GtrA